MELIPHTALCIQTRLTPSPDLLAYLKILLSPDELQRASRFHFPHHQTQFITARGFMRVTLAHLLDIDPRTLTFNYLPGGKPFLKNQPLEFNLSHSGEIAVLAIDPLHAIGVDIEIIQNDPKLEIAERFFSNEEKRHLYSLAGEEQKKTFFAIWSKKEALVKAIGTGIQQSLSSFTVPLTTTPETIPLEGQTWLVQPLTLLPNYASALATHPDTKNVSIWQWVEKCFQKAGQK